MGHVRLGELPRTRKWAQVVALIAGGAGTQQVANATIRLIEHQLKQAARDAGVLEAIWLLMRLPLAARAADYVVALRACGLDVTNAPNLLHLLGAFTDAIDARLPNNQGRTDLGEMAQMAAVETLSQLVGSRTANFFGTTPEDVQRALAGMATTRQFSLLGKDFFARFMGKALNYFLSRTLPNQVGEGQRFTTLAEEGAFADALELHCREAAYIVEDYCGEWYAKNNYFHGGIERQQVAGFTGYAMTKLIDELKRGARA